MAFQQRIGPGASAKQVQQLLELIQAAGYATLRSARGPLGLTQRQGIGKFTSTEADELIEQLESEAEGTEHVGAAPPPVSSAVQRPFQDAPTELLVAELQSRGWSVSRH